MRCLCTGQYCTLSKLNMNCLCTGQKCTLNKLCIVYSKHIKYELFKGSSQLWICSHIPSFIPCDPKFESQAHHHRAIHLSGTNICLFILSIIRKNEHKIENKCNLANFSKDELQTFVQRGWEPRSSRSGRCLRGRGFKSQHRY